MAVTSYKLPVIFPNFVLQTNGYGCGLYAAANVTALAYERDTTTQVYTPRMIRNQLNKCFENKHIERYPVANIKAKRKKQKKDFDAPLYCVCNMHDTRILYIYSESESIAMHVAGNTILSVLDSKHPAITSNTEFVCPK